MLDREEYEARAKRLEDGATLDGSTLAGDVRTLAEALDAARADATRERERAERAERERADAVDAATSLGAQLNAESDRLRRAKANYAEAVSKSAESAVALDRADRRLRECEAMIQASDPVARMRAAEQDRDALMEELAAATRMLDEIKRDDAVSATVRAAKLASYYRTRASLSAGPTESVEEAAARVAAFLSSEPARVAAAVADAEMARDVAWVEAVRDGGAVSACIVRDALGLCNLAAHRLASATRQPNADIAAAIRAARGT